MKIHNFQDSLKASYSDEDEEIWQKVYENYFGDQILSMNSVREDGWAQRAGIDRIIVLKCGRTIRVDEKMRAVDYGDIAIEAFSDYRKKIPGWGHRLKKLAVDFIGYAIRPAKICYLIPYLPFRKAIENNRNWYSEKNKIYARNAGHGGYFYETESFCITPEELFNAINEAQLIRF